MTIDPKKSAPAQIEPSHSGGGGIAPGGKPPYDGSMEARLSKLEEFASDARERLAKIEVRLDQTATKADIAEVRTDLHEQTSTMIKWIVGTVSGLGVAGITIMTFVLNNAVPKAAPVAPSAPQAPIVIYAQPAPVATPPVAPPAKP
ncbi:hypothetical protein ACFOLJ_29860 [Rugamonas sp. CCM 8940]|uniref:hypothetical protein n=1 Tax=Rugamonas sp. CCM 8940 TaxID=2765359 RepID=UPI0018F4A4A0|nr:hypothetical protein [Rugamonas sp. CCM 8940]MBJ7313033.1 hypothetical protein [Rugamonas sp. CCM 8940]